MGIEIERKFLVDHEQWQRLAKPQGEKLQQGYMINDNDKTIRLRMTDKQGYLTFKSGKGSLSRNEYEYTIPLNDATELFGTFVKSKLEKTRYCITFADKLWEVDVFLGDNEGLIVAEIELDSEDEQFDLPPWVTDEVSGDERYYNSGLSMVPFRKW